MVCYSAPTAPSLSAVSLPEGRPWSYPCRWCCRRMGHCSCTPSPTVSYFWSSGHGGLRNPTCNWCSRQMELLTEHCHGIAQPAELSAGDPSSYSRLELSFSRNFVAVFVVEWRMQTLIMNENVWFNDWVNHYKDVGNPGYNALKVFLRKVECFQRLLNICFLILFWQQWSNDE